jgi:hypothetical protein
MPARASAQMRCIRLSECLADGKRWICGLQWALGRFDGQGARVARFGAAAVGGTSRGRA